MLFQLQALEDSRSGSRNWEGDDTYLNEDTDESTLDITYLQSQYSKINITWKHPKESFTISDRNIILFGVRGVGSCYLHANFNDSVIAGVATITKITNNRETTTALEKDTLKDISPAESVCLLCYNPKLLCWIVCCQVIIPPELSRFLVENIINALTDNQKVTSEVYVFDSFVASLYRTPSRERVEPPLIRAVASEGVGLPGCCPGLETPNIVEGLGAAAVNFAHFSEGMCKAAVFLTLVEAAYVEPRAVGMFDRVVEFVFEKCDVMFANESEIGKVLRKTAWTSPNHLFC